MTHEPTLRDLIASNHQFTKHEAIAITKWVNHAVGKVFIKYIEVQPGVFNLIVK